MRHWRNNNWNRKAEAVNVEKRLPQCHCKVKVYCTLVQVLRLCTGHTAHRGSRVIALLFLDHGIRRGEGSALRPGRSSAPGKTRYPLYRRMGGPQGQSGQVRRILPPPGFDPQTVRPVALLTTLPGPLSATVHITYPAWPARHGAQTCSSNSKQHGRDTSPNNV